MRQQSLVFPMALAFGAILPGPDVEAREPIQIKRCQTISEPGSYELANNLTAARDCLVITADFVTIDLAGFTISGTQTQLCGGTAIAAGENTRGITVRNGSISGFGTGVDLAGEGSVVEGLRLSGNSSKASVIGIAAKGIVRGNIVEQFACVLESGIGISATGIVTDNYVNHNQRGIGVGEGSTVIGNTVTNNLEGGLLVSCPSNVTNNTAVNNGQISLPGGNLSLSGDGCNNTNNVAP
jgi:hypothetical protein